MKCILRVEAQAGRTVVPSGDPSGLYVQAIDPDAHGGAGDAALVEDPAQARQFDGMAEALAYWRQQSTV